jgi:phosphoribosyl 1,2-cyclic phosphate phosphodiesterase
MTILFLGTAAAEGIPALFCACETCLRAGKAGGRDIRARSGFLVNGHLLIDLSPDIMLQKRLYSLDLSAVDTLCFTHSHTDHLDTAELTRRSSRYYAHIPHEKALAVYGNGKVRDLIAGALELEFGLPEDPSLEIHEIAPNSLVRSAELRLTALKARHDPAEDCLFYLVREGETSFLQMNDTALPGEDLEGILAEALDGGKLGAVSMDCTIGKMTGSGSHMGIGDNIALKERLMAAGLADEKTRFAATHFSHNARMIHRELEEALSPHGIIPAYDGMILELPPRSG